MPCGGAACLRMPRCAAVLLHILSHMVLNWESLLKGEWQRIS